MTEIADQALDLTIATDGRCVPDEIKNNELWVLWDLENKVPRAPWHTGHCYRAKWKGDLPGDERPETTYDEARIYSDIPTEELHRTHSFPTTDENGVSITDPIPDCVVPTILLPPDPAARGYDPALMYIDFDDVRNPETGEVSEEVRGLIDQLDSYTEISSSGTGIHVIVWANLPDLPGFGDFMKDLNTEGSIEIYDHGRFFGGTWKHVEGTPRQINERKDAVREILEAYADPGEIDQAIQKRKSQMHSGAGGSRGTAGEAADRSGGGNPSNTSSSATRSRSPYFDVDLERFAKPSPTERDHSGGYQGAHPEHGKTTGGTESTNYNLDTSKNRWHCFADSSGGGPMEMAAVMAGKMRCSGAGKGSLAALTDEEFLYTCLYARDRLAGFTAEMDPPYRALATIAEALDLSMANPNTDPPLLGSATHKIARAAYDEIESGDVSSLGSLTSGSESD